MTVQALRSYLTFQSSYPNDARFGQDGDLEIPGGRAILESLREGLLRQGFRISAVDMHDSYGWYFEVEFPQVKILCVLQESDEWLLITRELRSWKDALFGRRHAALHASVLLLLEECIRSDARLSCLKTYTEKEFLS